MDQQTNKTPLDILKCANCGNNVPIYHKKRLIQPYVCCSRKCLSEYKKKRNLNCICPICGKKIHIKPSHLSEQGNCCSYECFGKLRSIIYTGENNPNFGNKGPLNPIWKSDEQISYYGYKYIRCPNHPFKNNQNFVF